MSLPTGIDQAAFDHIIEDERAKQSAIFKSDKIDKAPPPPQARRSMSRKSMSQGDKVKQRIVAMLRRRKYRIKQALSDKAKEQEAALSFTATPSETTVPSYLPEKVIDSHRSKAMDAFEIPLRDKTPSYFDLYQ